MSKIVPTLPSNIAGPLGLLHLPRLWLKSSLGAAGQLADGYKDIGPGYDLMVLEAINIDPDAAREFIKSARPTYPQFEEWITQQPAVKLDDQTISDINAAVVGYHHGAEIRSSILADAGIPDEGKILDAVTLNFLDDLNEVHKALQAGS